MLGSKVLLDSGIQFGNFDLRVILVELLGQFLIGRDHLLTMSTPRSVEFNQDNIILG